MQNAGKIAHYSGQENTGSVNMRTVTLVITAKPVTATNHSNKQATVTVWSKARQSKNQ